VPDLATRIPTKDNGGITDDGRTYTITLRDGPQWNTTPARAVTAADLVRGVKRTCNPVQPFGGTPDFADLIVGYQRFCDGFAKVAQNAEAIADYVEHTDLPGVQATDSSTVVFRLTHPATYFVDMITMPAFSPAPREVLRYLPASLDLARHQISDGPYQIESYEPTKRLVFTRNPAWKGDNDPVRHAFVDRIVVDETVSQESIQQQLQTGSANADMEWDQGPPPSKLPGLVAGKDPRLNLGETASTNPYVVFNTVSPNNGGAMGKLQVRQALEYAINRDHLIQSLGGPQVNPPLDHVLPPNVLGSKDADGYAYDVDKARSLLAAAGYPNGLELKMLYRNASEGSRKAFATMQQDLRLAGITLTGVPSPNADFYTKYLQVPDVARRGVWDLALAGWGADWYGNAAVSFFKPLFSGTPSFPPLGSNYGLYASPTTNDLIAKAIQAQSPDDAAALWAKADAQVMQDAVFFPITNPRNPNYHAEQVHNAVYVPSMQNFDPTNVWLSQGMQGG
jgi:peptide/nickel transport system substrate-binding protein